MTPFPTFANLGPIMQLAYVTKSFDEAIASWVALGAGPFFVIDKPPFTEVTYRGRAIDLDITTCFGYWGEMQIEIIRQNNDAPSIFRDWQAAGRTELHHVCVQVSDIDAARRQCLASGMTIEQEKGAGDAAKFLYARAESGPDLLFELAQVGPPISTAFEAMHAASQSWDGTSPVRDMMELLAAG